MQHIKNMLDTHPHAASIDATALAAIASSTAECAAVCTACADACMAEANVQMLIRCIRLNLDCADVCMATSRLLLRLGEADQDLLRAQVEACRIACKVCGDECQQHAELHEHCRVCMERCRRCEDDCAQILSMSTHP